MECLKSKWILMKIRRRLTILMKTPCHRVRTMTSQVKIRKSMEKRSLKSKSGLSCRKPVRVRTRTVVTKKGIVVTKTMQVAKTKMKKKAVKKVKRWNKPIQMTYPRRINGSRRQLSTPRNCLRRRRRIVKKLRRKVSFICQGCHHTWTPQASAV